ncbi:MAG: hypothetical protein QJR12_11930 [Mycobacterium sp.]|uniref:divisome protein SepX/GlpR n=1 Tax=Mycobacterium sp. TaxID=1785 RepID=UPI00262ECA31|nr:gephyrin-like molybdotransferase receptor GlpR [Mycobacterium sp.]MDI3314942.1 hypothetical protein [Mycobacterium sp.]
MPSIPQSLLWISLVVLWLFVLVPMLVNKRDTVRRTSDVALATRVLNTAAGARLLKRTGPAAGHRSDPDWRAERSEHPDSGDDPGDGGEDRPQASAARRADPVQDAVEDTGGDRAADDDDADDDDRAAGFDCVEDTSGLQPAAEPSTPTAVSRRRRHDTDVALAVSARRYAFRKRMLLAMALMLVGSAAAAVAIAPGAWWGCAGVAVVTVLYLAYLRRQTRIEQRLRRRRAQRLARSRLGVHNTLDPELDAVSSRLRRPGAVVLEVDDEDPGFEHLDPAVPPRGYDLPRAAGQ